MLNHLFSEFLKSEEPFNASLGHSSPKLYSSIVTANPLLLVNLSVESVRGYYTIYRSVTPAMPSPDRDSPPWLPPSSNHSSPQSRPPLVIPVLRRVHRNIALGETTNGAEVKYDPHAEATSVFERNSSTVFGSPRGTAVGTEIPSMSNIDCHSTVQDHIAGSTSDCGIASPSSSLQPMPQLAPRPPTSLSFQGDGPSRVLPELHSGTLGYPSLAPGPKPEPKPDAGPEPGPLPGPQHPSPASPEPEPQLQPGPDNSAPASPSLQTQPFLKASPLWTAGSSKRVSVERRRQARTTEDERLVEEARKRTAGLIHRSRQAPGDRNHGERTSKLKDEMMSEICQIERTAAARASATKNGPPSKSLSSDKPTFHVDRGRTLERVISRRRNLGATDSPRPRVGGKRSAAPTASATASSSTKTMRPAVPARVRVPERTIQGATQPTAVSRARTATLRKQRSTVTLKEAPTPKPQERVVQKGAESIPKGHVERGAVRLKRSSAPSPEPLYVDHAEQNSMLEEDGITSSKNSRGMAKTAATMVECYVPSHNRSVSPDYQAVYNPKTRSNCDDLIPPVQARLITPVSMHSLDNDDDIGTRRREVSLASLSTDDAEVESNRSVVGSDKTVYKRKDIPDAVERDLNAERPVLSIEKLFLSESGHDEYHAENMSPVDLSKVSALRLPIIAEAAQVKFDDQRRDFAEGLSKKFTKAEEDKSPPHFGPKEAWSTSKGIIEPPQVGFNGIFPLESKSLEFQPGATSPIRSKSPARDRTSWGAKRKRKGITDLQWNIGFTQQLNRDVLESASNNSSRNLTYLRENKPGTNDFFARNSSEAGNDLSDQSSYPELQQSKYPLSCLTGSHRGRKLNVSFVSEADDGRSTKSSKPDVDFRTGKDLAVPSQVPASRSHDLDRRYLLSTSGSSKDEVMKSGTNPGETVDCPRIYSQEEYDKVEKGVRNATADARLLLSVSYPPPPRPPGLPDHVVEIVHLLDALDFLKAIKRRYLHVSEIYRKFRWLLEFIPQESLTDDKARFVDAEVAKLLADAPDLVKGYQRFRPCGKNSSGGATSGSAKVNTLEPGVLDDTLGIGGWIPPPAKQDKTVAKNVNDSAMDEKPEQGKMDIERLVQSLRKSAQSMGRQPGHKKPTVSPYGSMSSANFNPAAPEFKPLCKAFMPPGTAPPLPLAPVPQFSLVHAAGISTFKQNGQFRDHKPGNSSAPVFAPANANGAMHAMGYHSMPSRMANRPMKYSESWKKDLAAPEKPRPAVLEKPLTIKGTTYYTLPKQGISATATSLAMGPRGNARKDCRVAFANPDIARFGGNTRSLPRGPPFGRNNNTDPLWMYTPLVPIRKEIAPQKDTGSSQNETGVEHGIEAKRLNDAIAKMKLDEFTSRFPMTGKKSQVIPNMKQKYAAEIQHRLELVLYEKKEKEAAAKKAAAQMVESATSDPTPTLVEADSAPLQEQASQKELCVPSAVRGDKSGLGADRCEMLEV